MSRIYTRTGDSGETALFDGTRVSKADPRVEACGDVDELGSWLGLVRRSIDAADLAEILDAAQRDLFALGALLADPQHRISPRIEKAAIGPDAVVRLEGWIDRLDAELPPLRRFILSGGSEVGASLHIARAVCRRAERRIVSVEPDAVRDLAVTYTNRLSDLLFTMARAANHRAGVPETEW
ncbi:MAG: cob(I)yrinic acid a,c-diamide adenosyltransferase [Acidobacteria bacterium]|nr:cob(I)yrinic acid a,c-diamide adenosyltransferase [Acidobacteriota bacterium]